MSAENNFTHYIKNELGKYYGNWLPTTKLALGDFGYIENKSFNKLGNISKTFNIYFDSISFDQPLPTPLSIAKETDLDIKFDAKGSVEEITNASMSINFKKANAVYFKCICSNAESISELGLLKDPLIALGERWENRFVIVTDLLYSDNTIIAISKESNATVVLECENPALESINAEVNAKFRVSKQVNSDFCFTSTGIITPLIRIAKLKKKILRNGYYINYSGLVDGNKMKTNSEEKIIFELEREE